MEFLLVLLISVVLLALIMLGLGLKSIVRKGRADSTGTCHHHNNKYHGCACSNDDRCLEKDA